MLRKIGLSSACAFSSASLPHGYQSTGLWACCKRYGLVSCMRRFGIRSISLLVPIRVDTVSGGRRRLAPLVALLGCPPSKNSRVLSCAVYANCTRLSMPPRKPRWVRSVIDLPVRGLKHWWGPSDDVKAVLGEVVDRTALRDNKVELNYSSPILFVYKMMLPRELECSISHLDSV
jgi:hypothetical protein